MMCRSCMLTVVLCAVTLVPYLSAQETTVDTAVNRSLYQENELWDGLMQNCGQKTTFSCVQTNIYGFLERSLQSDFYVTDGFFFKKNENKYSEEMNSNLFDGVASRESRSRWSKLNKSFGDENTPRDVENKVEEEKVFAEMEKDDREEQESFSEFVKAVEEAEKSFDEKRNVTEPEVASDTTTFEPPATTVEDVPTTTPVPPEEQPVVRSISAVSDFMYSRGLGYFMTHDLELHLPSFVFGGAKVTVSPRSFESDGGALLKFNIEPAVQPEDGARTINIHKKIFHKKLMSSMLAALLIMKLIKVKLMFLLPVFLGVGTAKKILLKALLFIFPALAHLFKLCSYYHHKAKYHHHHHQIAHHHHHLPVSVPVYHGPPSHSSYHHSAGPPVVSSDYGPPGAGGGYEVSGPSVEWHSRTESPGTLSQHGSELASWGLGEFPASWEDPRVSRSAVPVTEPTGVRNYPPHRPQPGGFQYPENEVIDVKPPPPPPGAYPPHKSGFGGPPSGPDSFGPDSFGPSGLGGPPTGPGRTGQAPPPSAPAASSIKSPVGAYSQAVHTRLQALTPRPPTSSATNSGGGGGGSNLDPFYSPMLRKIDAVFIDMGVMEEGCRERLVCSMYKNPSKFSPHSNLMSAQLSKEPSELKKPTSMNPSVVRYFKYMQAARDGQEFKDCLRSYSSCNINTER
ncbi:uncharacterized protein LOC111053609 isoform X1 [Nilaparvata lugens]|uniref:uncharacterized protein LOC111053609 isoform X1 n=1 Tax=Nilaparvata lugens TaxID=108931 RepID=UPI00193E2AF2|nr:uncharacterized protein LOC111053609 isoform X1 [Nilaparvata lugens]